MLVDPGCTLTPEFAEQGYQLTGRHAVALIRSYIIISLVSPVLILSLGNFQIRKQRLQYMLEWSGRIWVPHHDLFFCCHGTHAVRNDPVVRKVPAADDITRACGRNRAVSIRKEGFLVAVCYQFRAGFAVGVRIVAI